METVGRKGGRKWAGEGASGSSRHDPSHQGNRKRVLEEGQKKKSKAGKAKRKTGSKVEVGLDLGNEGKEVGKEALACEELAILQSMFGGEIQEIFGLSDDDAAWTEWMANLQDPPTISEAAAEKMEESMEEWEMRILNRTKLPFGDPLLDYSAYMASRFRSDWEYMYSPHYGAFEDTTRIPAMRFTSKPPDEGACPTSTLQVFSVRVEPTRLQFPLRVFGLVATRDTIDNNRNVVFQCGRDHCQTLTKEHPYLVLTGPTRAVFLESTTPVTIEVDLRVKGTDHSEDEQLSSLAVPLVPHETSYSRLWNFDYTSKISTVHMTLGCVAWSVEATIFVQVTSGSWPVGFQGQFSAFAKRSCNELPYPFTDDRVDDEEIVLLQSRGESLPLSGDGSIALSRHVVSVQNEGELKVCVKAWRGSNITKKWTVFKPSLAGRSNSNIDIDGLCAMNVTVVWSLISYHNVSADSAL